MRRLQVVFDVAMQPRNVDTIHGVDGTDGLPELDGFLVCDFVTASRSAATKYAAQYRGSKVVCVHPPMSPWSRLMFAATLR